MVQGRGVFFQQPCKVVMPELRGKWYFISFTYLSVYIPSHRHSLYSLLSIKTIVFSTLQATTCLDTILETLIEYFPLLPFRLRPHILVNLHQPPINSLLGSFNTSFTR